MVEGWQVSTQGDSVLKFKLKGVVELEMKEFVNEA